MNLISLNAAILPLLAILFISDSIRDRETGEYFGFLNLKTLVYGVSILAIEAYLFSAEFGVSFLTILRVVSVTAMPFIGAYVFVRFSHKQNYGVEFPGLKGKSDSEE